MGTLIRLLIAAALGLGASYIFGGYSGIIAFVAIATALNVLLPARQDKFERSVGKNENGKEMISYTYSNKPENYSKNPPTTVPDEQSSVETRELEPVG